MANRDQPVNGRLSRISLQKSGNLVITDADGTAVWATNTFSDSSVQLYLQDSGNLALYNSKSAVVWQSFDFPTDTLLPYQPLTRDRQLVSSRSQTNSSSGFFILYFDNDNILRLLYSGPLTSSIYWPDPDLMSWEAGRSSYNSSRIAFFDLLGNFSSTDDFTFMSADYGAKFQRRLTIDFDGNVRMYSREDVRKKWAVTWDAMTEPCRVHGICGPNNVCSYVPGSGRRCSCIPGFKIKDQSDWSLGCEPEFNQSCITNDTRFLHLTHVEFYGYDYGFYPNYTLEMCENLCLQRCDCKGFQFKFVKHNRPNNIPYCFVKTQLLNGHRSPDFPGDIYLKVPKLSLFSVQAEGFNDFDLTCSDNLVIQMDRKYASPHGNGSVKFFLWFAAAIGAAELCGIIFVSCFLMRTHQDSRALHLGYLPIATGFRRFTYVELEKATQGFSKVIGKGGGGIVYKGVFSDYRVSAVKQLCGANYQGEAEFQAEISTIEKLNHINLIEMWGYCVEGKHRLLVYRYMENGSLAEKLQSDELDWEKRFDIAVGTAKGLAYLHEECLEWVLHCDVKPQNILLDDKFQPKVSDFGLSRPLKRDSSSSSENSSFSKIRGTRGYIAPEWLFNQPITSKVDVYSYGIVLLELVTGRNPTAEVEDHSRLVRWVREMMNGEGGGIESVADPKLCESKQG